MATAFGAPPRLGAIAGDKPAKYEMSEGNNLNTWLKAKLFENAAAATERSVAEIAGMAESQFNQLCRKIAQTDIDDDGEERDCSFQGCLKEVAHKILDLEKGDEKPDLQDCLEAKQSAAEHMLNIPFAVGMLRFGLGNGHQDPKDRCKWAFAFDSSDNEKEYKLYHADNELLFTAGVTTGPLEKFLKCTMDLSDPEIAWLAHYAEKISAESIPIRIGPQTRVDFVSPKSGVMDSLGPQTSDAKYVMVVRKSLKAVCSEFLDPYITTTLRHT